MNANRPKCDVIKVANRSRTDDRVLMNSVVKQAGDLAMTYFRNDPKAWDKSHDNPVSEADLAVDKFLHDALIGKRPDYGWLSEETEDSPERLTCERVWVVDPIDGTRAFLRGTDDWGVSVALIENHRVVLAAFYAPVKQSFYQAELGKGAIKNGQPIQVSTTTNLCNARMMGDPSAFLSKKIWPSPWPPTMVTEQQNSIALRLALVADGQFDMCVSLRPKNEWDVAATDLIVREAGGIVHAGHGHNFKYNRERPIYDHVIASNEILMPQVMEKVEAALKLWNKPQS